MKKEVQWLRLPKTMNDKAKELSQADTDKILGSGLSDFRVALDCHADDTCIA